MTQDSIQPSDGALGSPIASISMREGDEPLFLAALDSLVARLFEDIGPDEFVVTRVNKWFDHKWLAFSGSGRVGFDGWIAEVALGEHFQNQLTFPPFLATQTEVELYVVRNLNGFLNTQLKRPLLAMGRDHSSRNLQNRVSQRSQSGLYLWFSSFSEANGRGAVMVYRSHNGGADCWYASFAADGGWHLDRSKNISREVVKELFSLG